MHAARRSHKRSSLKLLLFLPDVLAGYGSRGDGGGGQAGGGRARTAAGRGEMAGFLPLMAKVDLFCERRSEQASFAEFCMHLSSFVRVSRAPHACLYGIGYAL